MTRRAGFRSAQDWTTSRSALRSGSRNWWNGWWKCQQSLFSSSRPVTFQFLVVVGVFIFKVSSQNKVLQLVAVEVFKVLHQDRFQQRHPQFLAVQLLRSTTRMSRRWGFRTLSRPQKSARVAAHSSTELGAHSTLSAHQMVPHE